MSPLNEPSPIPEVRALAASPIFFWPFAAAISLAAPVMSVFENLMLALIIAFGLWEAGRLNRRQAFGVSGPLRTGDAVAVG